MKIGMILDSTFPPDSRVENEAISLIADGHKVALFCFGTGKGYTDEIYKGIEVRRFAQTSFEYKMSALAYTIPLYHRMLRGRLNSFVESVKPDILHVHDLTVARAAIWVANKHNLPVTLDLHENRPVIMKEYVHLKKFPGNILINPATWDRYQTQYVNQVENIIVVTKEAKEDLVRSTGVDERNVYVVPNTVSRFSYLNYSIDSNIIQRLAGGFNLLYMGDTGLRRGTDTAIQAVEALKNVIPGLKLIMVGSNTEDVELQRMVAKYKLEEHVIFEGWQDVSLFPSYVKSADVCLSPIKRNRHHDTTFANKLFQYMAGGRPLVVSDCPPQVRVIEEEKCGFVFRAGDSEDLAEKILQLYENPEKRALMGENGKEAIAKRWNWEITSRELLSIYSDS